MFNVLLKKAAYGLAILFALCCIAPASAGTADDYPSKPIKIIVPYAAGGTGDTFARALGHSFERTLGQSVIVEDRPGAGSNIGTRDVAQSKPDGYTLLLTGNSFAVNVSLFKTLPYSLSDFTPITLLSEISYVMVVSPTLPVKNLQEFIAYAKAHPNGVFFGSSGIGGGEHLSGELMNSIAGLTMTHVPFKAATDMLTNLIGNNIQVTFPSMLTAMPLIKSGRLHALAVTAPHRSKFLSDVPTMSESGLPEFKMYGWYGLLAPAGTPPKIVKLLHDATVTALKDPSVIKTIETGGSEAIGSTPGEFQEFLKSYVNFSSKIIESTGIPKQ